MKTIAKFIGINEYLDKDIRDLSFARNDASALFALFNDNVSEIEAELIIDKNATVENIKKSIDESLGKASESDNVILYFSGHGTHSHQITAYDTSVSSLDDTTISMEFLAQEFQNSKAKNLILILDCCFSGGAPAKVVELSPSPKKVGDPFQTISGKGRVIITACNHDEVSYEIPQLNHGVFTHSLIQILLQAEAPLDVTSIYNLLKDKVGTETAKSGITQTPIFHGYLEGGLEVPNFIKGKHFLKIFPEPDILVNKNFSNLQSFGISQVIIDGWKEKFPNGFNELQLEAINKFNILNGNSLFVIAPTTSGKTFIGEVVAARCITQGKKSVFLLPYKALVNEKFEQFEELYGTKVNLRVIRCTGDYSDDTSSYIKGKYDIAFLTYEMFLNISLSVPSSLYSVGVVIVDEAQFITDPNRGIVVELLLTNLLLNAEKGVKPQIIILSAVIGSTNDFETWIRCDKFVSTFRPVPLIEGVISRNGKFKLKNPENEIEEKQLIPERSVVIRKEKQSSQDVIVPLVSSLLKNNEKILIFRNMKGSAQGCAQYLANDLGLPPVIEALEALPTHDLSKSSAVLRNCLNKGTAFHTANLSKEERAVIERSFRDPESNLKVLVATTTLAAGINSPASTVIIVETYFVGETKRDFLVAEYKNISGRAGRFGYNEEGKSIIIAETNVEKDKLFNTYVKGKLESLSSSFNEADLNTWLLRLLAQVPKIKSSIVINLLLKTYGGFLAIKKNPKWKLSISSQLDIAIKRMKDHGLLDSEDEFISLSLLGKACSTSSLSFDSIIRLIGLIKGLQKSDIKPINLLAIVQMLDEMDNTYTPMMKKGHSESKFGSTVSSIYGNSISVLLQQYARDSYAYYARCKRASIVWDWINGKNIEEIEDNHTCNPFNRIEAGNIRGIAETTRFHLRSASEICNLAVPGLNLAGDDMDTLLKQLELGLPLKSLKLLEIPLTLSRGEYLEISKTGVNDLENFKKMSNKQYENIFGINKIKSVLQKLKSLFN